MSIKESAIVAIILAAGKGSRMGSSLPKPLVSCAGKPIIHYIIDALKEAGVYNIVIVVGHGADFIERELGTQFIYVLQKEQKGTAHAVLTAKPLITNYKNVVIFVGDSPLIKPHTIKRLIDKHLQISADCTFLSADFPEFLPYARIVRDASGRVVNCVEEQAASFEERKIKEYLTSHFIFKAQALWTHLEKISPDSATGEYYLTDIIRLLISNELVVESVKIKDYKQLIGLNTPEELAWAERVLKSEYV